MDFLGRIKTKCNAFIFIKVPMQSSFICEPLMRKVLLKQAKDLLVFYCGTEAVMTECLS